MIIQFILPLAGVAGGVKVVYEYANRLQAKGHNVRIIYPGKIFPNTGSPTWRAEALLRKGKYAADKLRGKNEADWFPLAVPLIRTPSLEARYIPKADITIATSNETAEWVAKLPARCGTKFYFIQGYEVWSRDEESIKATFRLPLKQIVIATYLKDLVEKESGRPVIGMVLNGVDTKQFYRTAPKTTVGNPPQVMMLSHTWESKGIPDGLKAIAIARQEIPRLKLVMFGAEGPRPDMPPDTEYHQKIGPEKLRELYAASDVFLCPARIEGGPLTPMEAMACGTAVVTTEVGAVPDYALPGKTAVVTPPEQPEKLGQALLSLLKDEKRLLETAEAGHRHIQQFSWENAAEQFEELLVKNV